MKWAMQVYWQHMKTAFYSAAAYRTNFIFSVIISLLSNLLMPLFTLLIYAADAQIPGWTFYEALLIQSCFMLCSGLCAPSFYSMVWVTMDHVKSGTYDLLMIKPGSTILITVAKSFELDSIGVLLGGLGMFIYSILHIDVIQPVFWLQFALFLICGIIFTIGLILIMSATAFKWVGNSRVFEIYESVTSLGRYPGTIYNKALLNVTTFIFPIATLGFFPASALLGKIDNQMYFVAIPSIVIFLLGLGLFKKMIYLYQSAGG